MSLFRVAGPDDLPEGAIGGWGFTDDDGETVMVPCYPHCLCCGQPPIDGDEVCAECRAHLDGGPQCRGNLELDNYEQRIRIAELETELMLARMDLLKRELYTAQVIGQQNQILAKDWNKWLVKLQSPPQDALAAADALAEACSIDGVCSGCQFVDNEHDFLCPIESALAAYRAIRHSAQTQEG